MNNTIEIVPALKRLELKHVGRWEELYMEFLSELNIITGDAGSGKSTIFRAIVKTIHPSARVEYPVSPTLGYTVGDISVELMAPDITLRIATSPSLSLVRDSNEPQGHFNLELLRSCIEATTPGTAILVEDEVIGVLDNHDYAEVVKLLNTSLCQVILIICHRLDPNQFRRARIYATFWDQEDDKLKMRLKQSGEVKS